jgi:PE-PPE domain
MQRIYRAPMTRSSIAPEEFFSRLMGRSAWAALMAGAWMLSIALMSLGCVPAAKADDTDAALNALMMGGSGMPTPSEFWRDTTITDYINPATGGNYNSVLVPTPESLSTTSNAEGLADLQAAMAHQELVDPGQPYLVEGYSQSAAITIDEKAQLLEAGQHPDVTFLLLGSLNRPDGGIYERFPGLDIPGLGGFFTYNGAEPTDAGIPTIDIVNQYDFFADFPQFPINPVADLNAVFGIIYAHAAYGDGPLPEQIPEIWPDSAPLSGPYDDQYVLGSLETVMQQQGDTTFYFIPTTELPLLDPLRSLGVPEPVLNIFQPALQVLVEAGYDRSIPFGDPTPAELIPTLDPATFTLEFANGVVQGANNAFELFGAQLPDFTQIESDFASAEAWSEANIGAPYDQAVTEVNNAFDPFTLFTSVEGPLGQDIQSLLDVTGVQQDLLNPILGLLGTVGGIFTS